MTPDDIVIRAVEEEISMQPPEMQARIKACYERLRMVYDTAGEAGVLALALLGAYASKAWSEDERSR
jgi:hypothetical protein